MNVVCHHDVSATSTKVRCRNTCHATLCVPITSKHYKATTPSKSLSVSAARYPSFIDHSSSSPGSRPLGGFLTSVSFAAILNTIALYFCLYTLKPLMRWGDYYHYPFPPANLEALKSWEILSNVHVKTITPGHTAQAHTLTDPSPSHLQIPRRLNGSQTSFGGAFSLHVPVDKLTPRMSHR